MLPNTSILFILECPMYHILKVCVPLRHSCTDQRLTWWTEHLGAGKLAIHASTSVAAGQIFGGGAVLVDSVVEHAVTLTCK